MINCSGYRKKDSAKRFTAWIFVCALLSSLCLHAQQTYTFQRLGEPLHTVNSPIAIVTEGAHPIAWTVIESSELFAVVGFDINTGKSVIYDMEKYGRSHIKLHRSAKGDMYIHLGRPAHFLKYDVALGKIIDLGQASVDGYYVLRYGTGPDGKVWIGAFPDTDLSWVDPATDKVGNLGRISDDPREQYIARVEVSDDTTVYCSVGLHHAEIWSVNPVTAKKKQILPAKFAGKQGFAELVLGDDGHVYGYKGDEVWRCRPDGIDFVDKMPALRKNPRTNIFRGETFLHITPEKELAVQSASGKERRIKVDFLRPGTFIYNLGSIIDGKIYGGGAFGRATLFSYDLADGKMKDLGVRGAGAVQVYDIIGHRRGIFFTTYTGGGIDLYEPTTGKTIPIAELSSEQYQQERLTQLCLGSDDRIYTGTIPIKGFLGGALVRISPDDLSVKVWRNIIPDQSIISVVSVPASREIFFTSGIRGGSGTTPNQKEGVVGLWDIKKQKVIWQGKPIPGTKNYGPASMGSDGMIYGIADTKYYVLNPKTRKVIYTGDLPVSELRHYAFHDTAAGPGGIIYGLGDDALFTIDPVTKKATVVARHESIKKAQGILVSQDGSVYYGSGAGLWCAKPVAQNH